MNLLRRSDLGHFLNYIGLTGQGVEVGVYRGDFSKTILSTWKGNALHLVDSWKHNEGQNDSSNVSDEQHLNNYRETISKFQYDDRVRIIRCSSIEAAKQFEDNSLDFVYIDADHSYSAVMKDLLAWYPKLKAGGLLCGHDYTDEEINGTVFGVKRAVDLFADEKELTVQFTEQELPYATWWVRKPQEGETENTNKMNQFRFHVVGLPHLPTSKANPCCAYTQKVLNFCKMMMSLGHTVYHYGIEGSEVECTEHIQILTMVEREGLMGVYDPKLLPNLDWNQERPIWRVTSQRAAAAIQLRKQPKDFLCLISGCQKEIVDLMPDMMTVEYGIGYDGVQFPWRVYESYAHLACVTGQLKMQNAMRNYDVVIPNYYDLNDFPFQPYKEDYYLYYGRLTNLKGVDVAVMVTKAAGVKLLIAGQGVIKIDGQKIITQEITIDESHVEYVGVLDGKRRADIVGKAKAILAPSKYHEPFGGVSAEAQLMGTPVISSDWGAFSETVEHGKTGYRCRTLKHYRQAIEKVGGLDYEYIHRRAVSLWSLERVGGMYQEYFEMLYDLYESEGWVRTDGISDVDWLSPKPYTLSFEQVPFEVSAIPMNESDKEKFRYKWEENELQSPVILDSTPSFISTKTKLPKVEIVTAAFIGLNGRPAEYYTGPAKMLQEQSPFPVHIYSQINVPETKSIIIDPDILANKFWRRGWKKEYIKLIANNPTHYNSLQATFPKVLGAWLGKFELLKRTFEKTDAEALLWCDAGHMISYHCDHDMKDFKGFKIDSEKMVSTLSNMLKECSLALVSAPMSNFHMPYEWMMHYWHDYSTSYVTPAAFIFVHRDKFDLLYNTVRKMWIQLIEDGKAGTEENALTLAAWELNPFKVPYTQWCSMLGFSLVK